MVVTTVVPGPTRTDINEASGAPADTSGAEWMDPREVARQSLDAADKGRQHFVPGYVDRVRNALTPRFTGGAFGACRNVMVALGRKPSHFARRLVARLR